VVSLRMADGGEASFPLRQVQGRQVVAAVPWRPGLLPEELLDEILAAVRPGDTIGGVTSRAAGARTPGEVKAAVLRLLWQQRLTTDLHSRLDSDSALEATA
jgi:hypothetical protein